jgi:hypothetical protein
LRESLSGLGKNGVALGVCGVEDREVSLAVAVKIGR